MSTLLVNRDLQTEYAEITNKILELKDKLLNKMKLSAGIRKDIEQIIVDDFSVNNFYKILDMYEFFKNNLDFVDYKKLKSDEMDSAKFHCNIWIVFAKNESVFQMLIQMFR